MLWDEVTSKKTKIDKIIIIDKKIKEKNIQPLLPKKRPNIEFIRKFKKGKKIKEIYIYIYINLLKN